MSPAFGRLLIVAALFAQDTTPQLYYSITVPRDRSVYLVELQITNPPHPTRLVIPAWAPGTYRLMNSGQNIGDVEAINSAGDHLPVRQDSPISWVIDPQQNQMITVRYAAGLRDTVQWRRPNNRWFLRAASGIVDGPRTFMYLDGWKQQPARVTFQLPAGWHVATGLDPANPDSTIFQAPSYDVLIDAPMLLGRFFSYSFTAAGTPYRVVVDVAGARMRASGTFVKMLRRIATTTTGIFGAAPAPYEHYTFIFVGGRGGGLEHLNSTTIGVPTRTLTRAPFDAAAASAHELFHAWNVKRIRPIELGPFAYDHAVRTVNLWWCEGVTDYYTDVILARAGLYTRADFARHVATAIETYQSNPGRLVISPEASSWTTWDPLELNHDATISYYLQGELLGFILDLAIRDSTDNAKSLDDVMRYLLEHYAGTHGYTRDELMNAVRDATGHDFTEFWRQYVSGVIEIPWNDFLQAAGWRVVFRPETTLDTRIGAIAPAVQGGRWRAVVPVGAASSAGLRTGDELVKIGGRTILDGGDVTTAVASLRRGRTATIEIVRDGQPLTIRFRPGSYQRQRAELHDLPVVTAKMQRIRAGLVR